MRAAAPVIYQAAMGLPQNDADTLPVDPVQLLPTYGLAKAAFEAERGVRVLFDNGAGTSPTGASTPGDPYAGFEKTFATFPVPGTSAEQWYLNSDGTLTDGLPSQSGVNWYTSDASALPLTDYSGGNTGGGGLWGNASEWTWNWQQNPAGKAVSYVTAPLGANTTVVGGGAVDLWVMSSTPDVDLQATVSEVRPDGKETFVQNGWIRASERALACATCTDDPIDQGSTPLEPEPTMLQADLAPMPAGQFVEVVIPLYFEGHVYRAGSRIRVTIAAPNGSQPVWSFGKTQPTGTTSTVSILSSPETPSSLVLPVVPGVQVPTALPPCPSLRNEPCRAYVPFEDQVSTG